MKKKWVTLGKKSLNKEYFIKPRNRSHFIKPLGGLWASPLKIQGNFISAWHEWCYYNMEEWLDDNAVVYELKDNAKILTIDSLNDLEEVLKTDYVDSKFGTSEKNLNFQTLANKYDAIYLTEKGEAETRWSENNLYGWDCESLLILNFDCIENIEYKSISKLLNGDVKYNNEKNSTSTIRTISSGQPSTLGTYRYIAFLMTNDENSEIVQFFDKKIAESPNGENEEVIADESQMMFLIINSIVNHTKKEEISL